MGLHLLAHGAARLLALLGSQVHSPNHVAVAVAVSAHHVAVVVAVAVHVVRTHVVLAGGGDGQGRQGGGEEQGGESLAHGLFPSR
ncbi:hypothetical protein D3C78_1193220 [compost metagenome]